MEAIRKKIKRNGNKITFDLPEDFKAENIELIILPDDNEEKSSQKSEKKKKSLSEEALEFYGKYKVDMSNYKFDRDELHDR
ncbi:MAG: hypothetical protein M3R36_03705 [Bacteroidota bacterium]|nr:hypothetical protein [Bacteroidota bacterium]